MPEVGGGDNLDATKEMPVLDLDQMRRDFEARLSVVEDFGGLVNVLEDLGKPKPVIREVENMIQNLRELIQEKKDDNNLDAESLAYAMEHILKDELFKGKIDLNDPGLNKMFKESFVKALRNEMK